ncbi:MAG: diguanylate cyclase [Desulfobacter sp.]|nr:MAG: diguanylate cyclase [Desulfobacter sp.]
MNDFFSRQFALMDDLPIGVFVVDDHYHILFWNRCMENWTKKSFSQVEGRELHELYPRFRETQYTSRIDSILGGGPPIVLSSQLHGRLFSCVLSDGEPRILQTTVTNVQGPGKDRCYAMFAVKDVTELSRRIIESRKMEKKAVAEIEQRKAVEKELRRANDKILAQTRAVIEEERLKVLLQMAGATAHELNQPLMILLGNLELLEMDRDHPDKLLERIQKINTAGKRIADIIKKIQNVRHVSKISYSGGGDIIDIHRKERILCVEDDPACFKMIKTMLADTIRPDLSHALTLDEAIKALDENRFDLVILGYVLPDGDAFDLLAHLKERDISIPAIVLIDQGDGITASQLFRQGASDYLSRQHLDKAGLVESIRFSLEQHLLKQDRENPTVIMGADAARDELTGLFNRRFFAEALERETSGIDRYDNDLALCLLNIDHFKKVNDTYGHPVGDKVLVRIARFITENLRKYDIPCRYGGEVFGILLPNTGKAGAESMCNRIREQVALHHFEYGEFSFNITLSAGIAMGGKTAQTGGHVLPEYLIQAADTALYRAKDRGRNMVVVA